ncbi:response regulator [Egbenema bharatensis]|uniref:response regulator n=1 Tax=Egbenema bharatensis TaxID=3463334 RepID=UPI003A860673
MPSTDSEQGADGAKFVLMIQPMNLQGSIWQSILRSQSISVIWEAADVNLADSLDHLKSADFSLPDLILIDTRVQTFNPYTFCRWCREHYPEIKIVLVNGAQREIIPSEREWAVFQGAADLFPRFRKDALVSGAVNRMRRILDLLNCPTLNQGALVSALLTIQRLANHKEAQNSSESFDRSSFSKHL